MSKFRAPSAPDTRPGASQSGLSLVELLIATALGLILTLVVIQIYLSGNETYRQTQGLAHAQESTRFVSAVLTPDLRSAGSFGCLAEMGRPLDQVVDNRLNGGLVVPLDQALQGWEYTGTGPGDSVTLANAMATPGAGNWASGTAGANLPADLAGSVITNSDVIIVNALTSLGVPLNPANPQMATVLTLTQAREWTPDLSFLQPVAIVPKEKCFRRAIMPMPAPLRWPVATSIRAITVTTST